MTRRRQLLDLQVSGEFSQPDVTVAPRNQADELPAPLYGFTADRSPEIFLVDPHHLAHRAHDALERIMTFSHHCPCTSLPGLVYELLNICFVAMGSS